MQHVLEEKHDGLAMAAGAMMFGYILTAALVLGQYLGAI